MKVCGGSSRTSWPSAAPGRVHQRGPAVVVAAVHRRSFPEQEPHQVLVAAGGGELQRRVALLVRAVHRNQRQHVGAVTLRPSLGPQAALPPGLFGGSGLQNPPGGLIVPLVTGAEEQQRMSGDPEIHVFISVSSSPKNDGNFSSVRRRRPGFGNHDAQSDEFELQELFLFFFFFFSSNSAAFTSQRMTFRNFRYNLLTTKQLCRRLPAQPRFRYFCGIPEPRSPTTYERHTDFRCFSK